MTVHFHVVIPARYHSKRLPQKLLLKMNGMTVIEHVYRQAQKAKPKSITIATDHKLIFEEATRFGASVMMTNESHPSGTDRIAEVVQKLNLKPDEIVVNVQGDEPLIPPELICQWHRA